MGGPNQTHHLKEIQRKLPIKNYTKGNIGS